jgi:glutathione S-transferase
MITIHGIFGSPFVRALRIALSEKNLAWGWAPFVLGAHKQEPYISRHPFGKIPAIDDDGFELYETQAMLRYIDRKAPEPALTPSDTQSLARMDQILAIVDCYLWPTACRPINFNRLIAPRIGMTPDEAAVAEGVPHATVAVAAIAKLQGRHEYLAGDALSLADIAVIPHLDGLSRTAEGAPLIEAHTALAAWLERMRARQSVRDSNVPPEKLLAA